MIEMNESSEQQRATARRIIQYIIDQRPFGELTNEERRIAKECVDKKYIKGVELIEMVTGRIVMEIRHDPVLTDAGAAFMAQD